MKTRAKKRKAKDSGVSFRFSFEYGIVGGNQFARVVHMANCCPPELSEEMGVPLERCMSKAEWTALDGHPAEFLGGCSFQVGRAVVTVQDGCRAPYGVPIRWEPLPRSA